METRKTPQIEMKEIPPTPAPESGTLFRNGDIGWCEVTSVWKSRFGDWKVSFKDERGGGGIINLDHFNETIAVDHALGTPTGPMCSPEDHERYASRGKCALCGRSFYPPNADVDARCPGTTNQTDG